jgi:putative SOS response-associated peptidase YedK
MCYSAQIKSDYLEFVRALGARISLHDFYDIYWRRANEGLKVKIPRAVDLWFSDPQSPEEAKIKAAIDQYDAAEATRLEQELFKQRKRLADAERALQIKPTKTATESQRIATDKVAWCLGKLTDLRRREPVTEDSRIFPGWYAPVLVMENGQLVVKPMRYQCRPAGKPPFYDTKFPGTYNARRDSLGGFWKEMFGRSHGILVVNAFFENVNRGNGNVVLEFRPQPAQAMLVACLWSRWSAPGEPDLLSFAAITDEPPNEVAAAGHDRCIVPIKPEHVDAWLNARPDDLRALQAILDDRERPYYENRLAA